MRDMKEIDPQNSRRKLIHKVGINDADYVTQIPAEKWRCPYYDRWASMIQRCYDPKYLVANPSYAGHSVCEEWHSFMTFREWMMEQDWEGKHLDKDILGKGTKIYSPETCIFVHPNINVLLATNKKTKGAYPTGVYARGNRFRAKVNYKGKGIGLGTHPTPEEAYDAYVEKKYEIIKEIANEQSDERLKNALLEWKINSYEEEIA